MLDQREGEAAEDLARFEGGGGGQGEGECVALAVDGGELGDGGGDGEDGGSGGGGLVEVGIRRGGRTRWLGRWRF